MSDHDSSMENDDLENSGGQSSATVQVVSQSAAKKILNQLKKMEKSLEGEIQCLQEGKMPGGEPGTSIQEESGRAAGCILGG